MTTCPTCEQGLVVGTTYNITGVSSCGKCASVLNLSPNTAIYDGTDKGFHKFTLTVPQVCSNCHSPLNSSWIPCIGTDLALELFKSVYSEKTSQS